MVVRLVPFLCAYMQTDHMSHVLYLQVKQHVHRVRTCVFCAHVRAAFPSQVLRQTTVFLGTTLNTENFIDAHAHVCSCVHVHARHRAR